MNTPLIIQISHFSFIPKEGSHRNAGEMTFDQQKRCVCV